MNIKLLFVDVPLIRLSIFDISCVRHEGGPLKNSEVSSQSWRLLATKGTYPLILVRDWQNLLGQSGSELWQPKEISVSHSTKTSPGQLTMENPGGKEIHLWC